LNVTDPVPVAVYVHVKLCAVPSTTVTPARLEFPASWKLPAPLCTTADGVTPVACALPVLFTVNTSVTTWPTFTVALLTVSVDTSAAGVLTLM
jgi:hypothetical protein